MKKCELCNSQAKMFCESDQASLCWDCDARVHAANFLVSKHSRTLLCHVCQGPTPWHGSGPKLNPTVAVCPECFNGRVNGRNEANEETNAGEGDDSDGDNDEEDDNGNLDEDDEENQVVPESSKHMHFAAKLDHQTIQRP